MKSNKIKLTIDQVIFNQRIDLMKQKQLTYLTKDIHMTVKPKWILT